MAIDRKSEIAETGNRAQFFPRECKILKQYADRVMVFIGFLSASREAEFGHEMLRSQGSQGRPQIEVSQREAKFFLDRKSQNLYHVRKFFGYFPSRAKIHLHVGGKVVNCRSYVWDRAEVSCVFHNDDLFGKAKSSKRNLIDSEKHQLEPQGRDARVVCSQLTWKKAKTI